MLRDEVRDIMNDTTNGHEGLVGRPRLSNKLVPIYHRELFEGDAQSNVARF